MVGAFSGQLGARLGDDLVHLAEDVQASFQGLAQGDLHDLFGDTVDLDVHLQGGDALVGTGNLEVHVAQVVFVTEDVGQDGELLAFLDQAMAIPATGALTGTPASISAREAPHTEAIELEPLDSVISETTRMV